MDTFPSPAEERSTKKHPAQEIGYGIKIMEKVSRLTYWMWYYRFRSRQWQHLEYDMERDRRWEWSQRESNKKEKIKSTPIPVDIRKLYCTAVRFAWFFYALLSFRARNFPAKSETQEPGANYHGMHLKFKLYEDSKSWGCLKKTKHNKVYTIFMWDKSERNSI